MQEYYEEQGNEGIDSSIKQAPCKRDFEFEINRYRDILKNRKGALSILEALIDNHGGAISNLAIKKLIGTAYVNILETEKAVAILIQEQEQAEG